MITNLRDILYFDFEKAASLISQIEGGLAKERTESSEDLSTTNQRRGYDLLKLFRAEFGEIESDKRSVLEIKVLHHDLLLRLEETLFSEGFAVDVNSTSGNKTIENIRSKVNKAAYLRVEGWCAIEDFNRVHDITKNFNSLISFVNRSSIESRHGLDAFREKVKAISLEKGVDSKERRQASAELERIEKRIALELEQTKLSESLLEGIRTWIDTLAKHRLNIRLVPFENLPDFEFISNLKRECFVDTNLEHLLYGYGSQPNRKLTVFGLVTSVPEMDGISSFQVYSSRTNKAEPSSNGSSEKTDREKINSIEGAFRALFPAIQGMEKFISYHHYPRVILHPIAVYRNNRRSPDL